MEEIIFETTKIKQQALRDIALEFRVSLGNVALAILGISELQKTDDMRQRAIELGGVLKSEPLHFKAQFEQLNNEAKETLEKIFTEESKIKKVKKDEVKESIPVLKAMQCARLFTEESRALGVAIKVLNYINKDAS